MVASVGTTLSSLDDLFAIINADPSSSFSKRFDKLVEKSERIADQIDVNLGAANKSINVAGVGRLHRYAAYTELAQKASNKLEALQQVQESMALAAARVAMIVGELIDLRPRTTLSHQGTWNSHGYNWLKARSDNGLDVKLQFPTWQSGDWLGSLSFKGKGMAAEKLNLSLGEITELKNMDREKALAAWDCPRGTSLLRIEADAGEGQRIALHLAPNNRGQVESKAVFRSSILSQDVAPQEFRFNGNDAVFDFPGNNSNVLTITGVNLGKLLAKVNSVQVKESAPVSNVQATKTIAA